MASPVAPEPFPAPVLSRVPLVDPMAERWAWLAKKSPGLHKFLTRRDKSWPLLREALGGILALGILVTALYGFTGQGMPFDGGYPVVVVTTGSMMHCENGLPQLGRDCDPTRWGRLGTIDPGDLVFVRKIDEVSDVTTQGQADGSHYGRDGDVIVYQRNGDAAQTPIIHRALFWMQLNSDGTYDIPEFGTVGATRLPQQALELTSCDITVEELRQQLGHVPYGPDASGFVTRGDNNGQADQCDNGGMLPARVEWVLGKARGEVPWIGLVNLAWGDFRTNCAGACNYENAGGDSKVMFFVTVAVLVATPWLIETGMRLMRRRREKREEEE